jgi:hypothetical protein
MRITLFLLPLLMAGAVGSSLAQYPEPPSLVGNSIDRSVAEPIFREYIAEMSD